MIFSGTAGEYFRIWMVNLFLTVLTCGIFAAWAKVRSRRYLYARTLLAGQPFDYMANPWFIFKGNLIVGAGILLYLFADTYNQLYSSGVLLAFYLVLPFLICKSLRFNAYNSAYRNIRFRFYGSLKESYGIYLLLPILIPLTLGLIVPFWMYRRKKYFFQNFSYGATRNSFEGNAGAFYRTYGLAGLVSMVFLGIGVAGFLGFVSFVEDISIQPAGLSRAIVLIPIISYVVMMVYFTLVQQYIFGRVTNYCWAQTRAGTLQFQSRLEIRKLMWIRLTNILAIFISFGLLIPWAKIRRTRYILNSLTIISERSLDEYSAAAEADQSAIGEVTTDFFDIAIGI
ncbi:MAG: hypothetical protein AMJ54_01185 [Deltaproteobacteria bacterium SG8_13]|nr:MAG: hypothetical protein AMJ54_01185 [Deltaproteobacteria bacterium SG8_13]